MNPFFRNLFQKCQIFMIIALGTAPVPMLSIGFFAEQLLAYAWVFPALYMLLMLLCLKIPGKLRITYGIVGILLLLVPGVLLPDKPMGTREVFLIIGAFYGVLLILSLQIASWKQDQELPVNYAGYCLVPHLLGQFVVMFDSVRGETWSRIAPWLTATLFLFVGLVMLSMNRSSVNAVAGKRQGSSAAIRGKNMLLTAALFGAALLASLIPSMMGAMISSFNWMSDWIDKLLSMLHTDIQPTFPSETVPVTTESDYIGLIPTKPGDPVVANITYIIVTVLAVLILLPLAVLVLIRIWKALKRMGGGFWSWFQNMLSNASEEYYEDEITDTREDLETETVVEQRGERLKSAFVNEKKMTPSQRIRYRYRRMAKKHPQWRRASTARENLPEEAASLYERARYSDHPISEDDAQRFKTATKQL